MSLGRRAAALGGAAALALVAPPAHAAPGDRQYATLYNHDQSGFLRALRAGEDFVKGGRGRQFRIVLAGPGVIVVIPGTSAAQREYMKAGRARGLEIIACKETLDALSKANKRRIPVLPGVSVRTCQSLRNQMTVAGWQVAPGF
jgi:intracellular sulfur oxidation DsrE/DsrF family protein